MAFAVKIAVLHHQLKKWSTHSELTYFHRLTKAGGGSAAEEL
jgi:hypothetical protein